eukprot:9365949-Ditylum_brightwellii.AAC.1
MDMIQELGQANRIQSESNAVNFSYKLCFCLGDFVYLFEQIHSPDKPFIDKTYFAEQVDNSMKVTKLLCCSDRCYFQEMKLLLGNPDPDGNRTTYGWFNLCLNCNDWCFLDKVLYHDGICDMLLLLFVTGAKHLPEQCT